MEPVRMSSLAAGWAKPCAAKAPAATDTKPLAAASIIHTRRVQRIDCPAVRPHRENKLRAPRPPADSESGRGGRREDPMTLTKGDDFPIHQTSEPIAYAGTDRNYYDRYFFNGYGMEGDAFFAVAFGVYPHLNIADAAFCLVLDGVQTSLHASRWLGMERMDLRVGPIEIEVVEPLQRLRVKVDAPDKGLKADVTFEARAFPIEEPRFIR